MEKDLISMLNDKACLIKTENGADALKTTRSAVYDMFALGGAYRQRLDEDVMFLFHKAYTENPQLALKCLFYLRDCRGGQGERRFFRLAFRYLCVITPDTAMRLVPLVAEYGRYDDLWYSTEGTPVFDCVLDLIRTQLNLDIDSKTPSLLAKWLPSENASSATTKAMANKIRQYLQMTHKDYRKMLSTLRTRINIVEKLMSENRWDEIEFDKIPSKAGLIYKNAFARRDIIAMKYEQFAKDKTTKVNAETLYPYDVVNQALKLERGDIAATERAIVNKYWENLPDYFDGQAASMLCMVDTSGSMSWSPAATAPINVAIGLGAYCADHNTGYFANQFMTFSRQPELVTFEGFDFVDKVTRVRRHSINENTNLVKAFNLLRDIALENEEAKATMPKTIVVISDMEIDSMTDLNTRTAISTMGKMRQQWAELGLELPHLVYWNVEARHDVFLEDASADVTFVSGCSPIIFKSVITGKTGQDLMMEILESERYSQIQ